MVDATAAKLWFWTDKSRLGINQVQILSTDFWSRFMTSLIAVCLTLAGVYVFRIARNAMGYVVFYCGPQAGDESASLVGHAQPTTYGSIPGESNGAVTQGQSDEVTSMGHIEGHEQQHDDRDTHDDPQRDATAGAQPNVKKGNPLLKLLSEAGGSRDFVSKTLKSTWKGDSLSEKFLAVVCILLLFFVFAGWATVCITSAKIASNRIGLSSSKHCGDWQYDDRAGREYWYRESLYRRKKEEQASQYAQNCYSRPSSADTLSCAVFYKQKIDFMTKPQQLCPFPSTELCYDGPFSAVTFDTGLVEASALGINAPVSHKFRRRTACSPLNMSDPYITDVSGNSDKSSWLYNYGAVASRNYTLNTSGRPFERLVPVYSADIYFSSLYPEEDRWKPRPDLKQAANSSMTLVFVTSNHIYYEEPNDDPLFPAQTRYPFDDLQKDYFFNNDSRARPMACVDTSEVCSADGRQCWGMQDPIPNTITAHPSFYLMKLSLENSNMKEAMWFRLGAAFEAEKKIGHSLSTPMESNQWEIEAENLFATSLARIQFDAWRIATGEDWNRHQYKEVTPEEIKGRLCNIYKFRTAAYTNVSLTELLGYVCLAAAIAGFSQELPSKQEDSPITPLAVSFAIIWVYRRVGKRTKLGPILTLHTEAQGTNMPSAPAQNRPP